MNDPGSARAAFIARRLSASVLALLLFSGCAAMTDVSGKANQRDVDLLRGALIELQRSVQQMGVASSEIDRRARQQSAENERQLVALGRRLDSHDKALAALAIRVDQLGTRVDALDRRMHALTPTPAPTRPFSPPPPSPTGPHPAPTPAPAPAPAPTPAPAKQPPPTARPVPPTTPAPTSPPQRPEDMYQSAYGHFSRKSYGSAISEFREFVRRHPTHDLAAHAQYSIGEAHLELAREQASAGQRDRAKESQEQAVREFQKVITDYPKAERVPAALYKEGVTLIDLKQPMEAKTRLQYLVDTFPRAPEATQARALLRSLR